MMNSQLKIILAGLILGVFFVSCAEKSNESPKDVTSPWISGFLGTVGNPNDTLQFPVLSGDTIPYYFKVSDDRELGEYTLKVEYKGLQKVNAIAWEKSEHAFISGMEQVIQGEWISPVDIYTGFYDLVLYVTDKAGNTTRAGFFMQFQNSLDPVVYPSINVTAPSITSIDTFEIGQKIPLKANFTDNIELEKIWLTINNSFANEELAKMEYNLSGVTSYNLDTTYTVPAGTIPGSYYIDFKAADDKHNVTNRKVDIYIIQDK